MNVRRLFILLFSIYLGLSASAQHKTTPTSVASAGGYYKNASHSNSWTLGQLTIKTNGNSNHKITQGFQQPEGILISGKILTEAGIAVPGVIVALSGSATKSMITTADGLYKFNVARGGNYTITPSKTNDVTTNNGITTLDISLIRKHILGNTLLNSPYKIIAADGNNSSTITTIDITLARAVILNNTARFPNSRLWEFVRSDQIFGGPPYQPFPFNKTRSYSSLLTNQINQNFIAVKLGDVNNSWNPTIP